MAAVRSRRTRRDECDWQVEVHAARHHRGRRPAGLGPPVFPVLLRSVQLVGDGDLAGRRRCAARASRSRGRHRGHALLRAGRPLVHVELGPHRQGLGHVLRARGPRASAQLAREAAAGVARPRRLGRAKRGRSLHVVGRRLREAHPHIWHCWASRPYVGLGRACGQPPSDLGRKRLANRLGRLPRNSGVRDERVPCGYRDCQGVSIERSADHGRRARQCHHLARALVLSRESLGSGARGHR
mmetsp:Transcript_33885/g.97487  ORF Transcript_33885/g.97487 Transcript_33885/m.97487 type:complete len:241 (+) Transcript_33885:143-865(+)